MKKNMGTTERTVRLLLGIALVSAVFIGPQTPWGWIGVVPLLTALLGWCPLYVPFGLSTCAVDDTGS